ncbi:putative gag/polymerase/env polyprotein, partial [Planoprotostelium fungivorum]
ECTSKTMSLELQLEEMFKTIEQKDKFITKQMMSLRKYMAHDIACFTFQVQQAGKRCVSVKLREKCVESMFLADDSRNTTLKAHKAHTTLKAHKAHTTLKAHKAHNNACLTTLWFSKQAETQHSRPTHMPSLASASMRHRLLSFSVQQFPPNLYKACSEHIKAYKCFAENLQTDHRKQAFKLRVWGRRLTPILALTVFSVCLMDLGRTLLNNFKLVTLDFDDTMPRRQTLTLNFASSSHFYLALAELLNLAFNFVCPLCPAFVDWTNWMPECNTAFNKLKKAFLDAGFVCHYDEHYPIRLETNASDFTIGGVIQQPFPEGIQPRIWSRKLTGAKLNYNVHDKELLAVVECCKAWYHWLMGSSDTTIFTD